MRGYRPRAADGGRPAQATLLTYLPYRLICVKAAGTRYLNPRYEDFSHERQVLGHLLARELDLHYRQNCNRGEMLEIDHRHSPHRTGLLRISAGSLMAELIRRLYCHFVLTDRRVTGSPRCDGALLLDLRLGQYATHPYFIWSSESSPTLNIDAQIVASRTTP